MSRSNSYKDSASNQASNLQESPPCHCFAGRGDSTIAHELLVLLDQGEAHLSHEILGVVCLPITEWNQALGHSVEYRKKTDAQAFA